MVNSEKQMRAVLDTREFLILCSDPFGNVNLPDDIRYQAKALLRHYPDAIDINIASLAYANFLNKEKPQPRPYINPLLEKLVEHAEPILIAISIAFTCVAAVLLISLSQKFG